MVTDPRQHPTSIRRLLPSPPDRDSRLYGILVLTLEGPLISAMTWLAATVPPRTLGCRGYFDRERSPGKTRLNRESPRICVRHEERDVHGCNRREAFDARSGVPTIPALRGHPHVGQELERAVLESLEKTGQGVRSDARILLVDPGAPWPRARYLTRSRPVPLRWCDAALAKR